MGPALAFNILYEESDDAHPTVGISSPRGLRDSKDATTHVLSDIPEKKTEVGSSSLNINMGQTIFDATAEPETLKVSEDRPQREKPHTPAFSEYQFGRKTAELIAHLNKLKQNLQNPEGAAIMSLFRSSLEQIWHVAGTLPREKIIILSAVEEAVRNKKWRELTIGQVDVLQHVLSNVNIAAEISKSELDRVFSAIHRSQIDIYPSAAEDFDDEETESDEE
jgi:hypothetical protein